MLTEEQIREFAIAIIRCNHLAILSFLESNPDAHSILLRDLIVIDGVAYCAERPLLLAASMGHVEIVRIILDKGANIEQASQEGVTALMSAASKGHVDVVNKLLDRGAAIEAVSRFQQTALLAAVQSRDNAEVVKVLLAHGADMSKIDSLTRRTAWDWTVYNSLPRSAACLLLEVFLREERERFLITLLAATRRVREFSLACLPVEIWCIIFSFIPVCPAEMESLAKKDRAHVFEDYKPPSFKKEVEDEFFRLLRKRGVYFQPMLFQPPRAAESGAAAAAAPAPGGAASP